ncbi:hypothetical protein OG218_13480 [Kineococcus sp. NBC_00420]|uniref:hypothetical protein n=1 Tax=Kineococcus sp. NBC_00420 TaxID=2903564 RepID=UPI002E1E6F2C
MSWVGGPWVGRCEVPGEAVEDLVDGRAPDVGVGILVPVRDPLADVGFEVDHVGVLAAAKDTGFGVGEQPFDEAERAGGRWG